MVRDDERAKDFWKSGWVYLRIVFGFCVFASCSSVRELLVTYAGYFVSSCWIIWSVYFLPDLRLGKSYLCTSFSCSVAWRVRQKRDFDCRVRQFAAAAATGGDTICGRRSRSSTPSYFNDLICVCSWFDSFNVGQRSW